MGVTLGESEVLLAALTQRFHPVLIRLGLSAAA